MFGSEVSAEVPKKPPSFSNRARHTALQTAAMPKDRRMAAQADDSPLPGRCDYQYHILCHMCLYKTYIYILYIKLYCTLYYVMQL